MYAQSSLSRKKYPPTGSRFPAIVRRFANEPAYLGGGVLVGGVQADHRVEDDEAAATGDDAESGEAFGPAEVGAAHRVVVEPVGDVGRDALEPGSVARDLRGHADGLDAGNPKPRA